MARLKAAQRQRRAAHRGRNQDGFAEWGYSAATTAAIAEAAGVTEPILYRHFKSKQELFVAITQAMSEQTLFYWKHLMGKSATPTETIRNIAKEFPNHLRRMADAYHVIHGADHRSRDRKVLSVMKEHYSEIEKFFGAIIAEGQKSGEFPERPGPPRPRLAIDQRGD